MLRASELVRVSEVSTRERVLQGSCANSVQFRDGEFQRSRPERGYCKFPTIAVYLLIVWFQRSRPERGYCKFSNRLLMSSPNRFQRSRPERGYCKICSIRCYARLWTVSEVSTRERVLQEVMGADAGVWDAWVSEVSTRERVLQAANTAMLPDQILMFQRSRPERGYCKCSSTWRVHRATCCFRGLDPREGTASRHA